MCDKERRRKVEGARERERCISAEFQEIPKAQTTHVGWKSEYPKRLWQQSWQLLGTLRSSMAFLISLKVSDLRSSNAATLPEIVRVLDTAVCAGYLSPDPLQTFAFTCYFCTFQSAVQSRSMVLTFVRGTKCRTTEILVLKAGRSSCKINSHYK